MKMSNIFIIIVFWAFTLPISAFAEIAVVVHPLNTNKLDEVQIRRIFLGKSRAFPDGSEAIPFDQETGSDAKVQFVSKLLNKNEAQLNAYWARMLFSSKAIPPKHGSNSEDVKKMVAQNPQSIGYIDSSLVDSTVKVIFTVP